MRCSRSRVCVKLSHIALQCSTLKGMSPHIRYGVVTVTVMKPCKLSLECCDGYLVALLLVRAINMLLTDKYTFTLF